MGCYEPETSTENTTIIIESAFNQWCILVVESADLMEWCCEEGTGGVQSAFPLDENFVKWYSGAIRTICKGWR